MRRRGDILNEEQVAVVVVGRLGRRRGHEVEVAALAHKVREPLVRREHLLVGRAADDVRGPLVA